MRWLSFTLVGLIVITAVSVVEGQTIYWKKDHIQDNNGITVATATPVPSDTTAPSAPTNLAYSSLTSSSVSLTWSASSDTGGSLLAGYKVYRGILPVAAVTGTSFTDSALQPVTSYTYTVVAFDNAGNHSSASNSLTFTSDDAAPTAPSGLSANRISNSQINLSWTDNSNNETGFKIERKLGQGGTYSQIDTVGSNVTSYSNISLSAATVYYYRVRAYRTTANSTYTSDGNACTCTSIAGTGVVDDNDARVSYAPGWDSGSSIPSSYNSTAHWHNTTGASATFSFSGDVLRFVYHKGVPYGIGSITIDGVSQSNIDFYSSVTTYRVTTTYSGLGTGNHTITIAVTGTKNASATGYYVELDALAVNADVPPPAPTSLSANTVSDTRIDLSWTENGGNESGFKIERKTGAGGTWSQIDTVGANVTSYPNTSLSASTTYYYRVRSYNSGGGDSAYSSEASATTNAPPQPTSLSANPTSVSQGNCYTVMAGNGANMTIDIQYKLNGGATQTVTHWAVLNSSAQASICSDIYTAVGTYTITAVRNTLNSSWVTVSTTITLTPGQPTSLSISPGSVSQGACYTMTVGNGGNMTLDVQYNFNGGATQTITGWPTLSGGQVCLYTDANTTPGTYTFTAIRNTQNTGWVNVNAAVTVTSFD